MLQGLGSFELNGAAPRYKLELLAEYDKADEGGKGVGLRREGLYSSYIVAWRRARDTGGRQSWQRLASWSMCRQNYFADPLGASLVVLVRGDIPASAGELTRSGAPAPSSHQRDRLTSSGGGNKLVRTEDE